MSIPPSLCRVQGIQMAYTVLSVVCYWIIGGRKQGMSPPPIFRGSNGPWMGSCTEWRLQVGEHGNDRATITTSGCQLRNSTPFISLVQKLQESTSSIACQRERKIYSQRGRKIKRTQQIRQSGYRQIHTKGIALKEKLSCS